MIARAEDLVVSGRAGARFRGQRYPCAIGRTGMTADKREGDGATPIGVFELESLMLRADRVPVDRIAPRLALKAWVIGPQDGWSDDPNDPLYNRRVRRPHPWRHERLARADRLYDVVGVLSANRTPIVAGAGSAIFLHRWRAPGAPTAGCVAFRADHLAEIFRRWTVRSRIIMRR